ncbi:ammonium transporter [Rhizobium halophytocola]|uniref:Amt family ammonium transporter n=1 Tax=Rhizobium halophytocola TaxID=735519 RepID=A0ABS4DVW1_9HYPH|nr:ammonium transporter [Rhizobium halophytocola]MBP1849820.1 Amt family ammonium transporter [Rhizobium halophytocola]
MAELTRPVLAGAGAPASGTARAADLDLSWLMVAAALVMLMQVGFLLLEAGMVRSKNSINVAQKNLLDFVFGVVAFAAVGFMLAFGRSGRLPIGIDSHYFFLDHLSTWEAGFFIFQVMFCGTAATIVSGAVAERMKLSSYVLGSVVLSGLIYPVFVHWAWGTALGPNEGAFLANLGFVDFAGSTVVHATGGWISLAACMVIGPRRGRFDAEGRPIRIAGHSPVLSTTGGLLLFIGWIGFNGGSTTAAVPDIGPIILNTILAGGMGCCVGYVIGYYHDGVVLPEKSISGMLGGLVAITAGCHLLTPGGSLLIGALGSAAAVYGILFIERVLRIDDAVGAIGVHAFAGVVGTVGLAFLAPPELLPAGDRLHQLYIQVFGAALNFYWAFGVGYGFFWLLKRFAGVRVSAEDEYNGLNIAEHGTRLGVGHVSAALSDLVDGKADLTHRLAVDPGDEAEELTTLFNRLMDDIEESERTRQALQSQQRDTEEAERVATLANATFEAIVMHEGGTIVDGNQQLAELTGLPLSDLIGRSVLEFVAPEDRERVEKAFFSGVDENAEISLVTALGERIPIEARGRHVDYRGKRIQIGCLVDLRPRREAERRIRHVALHDSLTGLANRTLFTERLSASVEHCRAGRGCAIVLLDLDRFKDVNDMHGHPAGDEVIRKTGDRLRKALGRDDLAARIGGDEFAVILTRASFGNQIEDFCRRLVTAFREPIDLGNGHHVRCGVSLGAALCPDHADNVEDLIGRADMALYHAKNAGRNTWRCYRPGMSELIEKRRALEADLEQAVENGDFELYLQPRVRCSDTEIEGYEALLRWTHPTRGPVSPVDFIPVAEASGKIIQLGEWVLAEACRILKTLPADKRLSINVSPIQFRQIDFLGNIEAIVAAEGADPKRIELEITESVLIDDDEGARQVLDALKRSGFNIALDDFGTGYSSLSYLSRYPFDAIKIDRSFVANLGVEANAEAIVRSIIDLGSGLGMKVVAEGVETIEQARLLVTNGCDELQGYLLGRPVPVDRIAMDVAGDVKRRLRADGDEDLSGRREADVA